MARTVPQSMTDGWHSQVKAGPARPVVRAVILGQYLEKFEYDTAYAQGGTFEHDRHRRGNFKSFVFGGAAPYRELPNIMSCEWERSVGQDAATCTLTLLNTEMRAIGELSEDSELDRPGWLTFSRGDTQASRDRWGYGPDTGWRDIIVPDRVVKTYEGYGTDKTKPAPQDPFLMQSGTWIIDQVTISAEGRLVLKMRDFARLLLDQIVFPPGIPGAEYPLTWVKNHSEQVPSRDAVGGHWREKLVQLGTARSSNDKYVGKGYTNPPFSEYVGANGNLQGHAPRDSILNHDDGAGGFNNDLYWTSTGQDSQDSFVWWEYEFDENTPLAAIRLRMKGGPYRIFISVHNGDRWVGKKKVPWSANGVAGSPGNEDIDADIPFVKSAIADRFWPFEVTLPRAYNAKRIRITITRLRHSGVGTHPYIAGITEMNAYIAQDKSDLSFKKGTVLKVIGNYGDWTHVVKWVCAWAGWYWPGHETGRDVIRTSATATPDGYNLQPYDYVSFDQPDPVLPSGRVWGDFMKTGTSGIADLTVEMFDKKPLMDIINYVRDLIGYLFFVDETAGVVWRQPNLWTLGNYLSPDLTTGAAPGARGRGGRTGQIVTLDENDTLLNYQTVLDSSNLRERIFVANAVGGVGTVIRGFNPYDVGLNRVAGWSNQNFASKAETQVAADLISAAQMFSYRTGSATIPGYPKIQVDDQVRIYERVTNETYYHYVSSIKSSIDMSTGEWTYDLGTHWLGTSPTGDWVVKNADLANVTRQYLTAIGYNPVDAEDKGVTH